MCYLVLIIPLVLAPPRDAVLPYDLSKRLPTWGAQYQPPSSANGSISGVDLEPNERALLGRLLARIHQLDPDLIIGHDLWGNQLDLLVHRMNAHKVPHWHRIGRLRRSAHFAINFNRVGVPLIFLSPKVSTLDCIWLTVRLVVYFYLEIYCDVILVV